MLLRVADRLTPQGIACVCYGFAKLNVRHDDLFAQLRDEVVYRGTVVRDKGRKDYAEEVRREAGLEVLPAKDSVRAAKLRRLSRKVMDASAGADAGGTNTLSRKQKELFSFSVRSLEQIAQAFARLGYYDQRLFFVVFSMLRSEVDGMRNAREKLELARRQRQKRQILRALERRLISTRSVRSAESTRKLLKDRKRLTTQAETLFEKYLKSSNYRSLADVSASTQPALSLRSAQKHTLTY
ncbi:unnamed protein product [Amoebophrya sp. A25]|nr:unnamed protein product [Amoebophrya sp. A25]|eukprot:GSA25T00017591001.1